MRISIWSRMLDIISPRACAVCGGRLAVTEDCLCSVCGLRLPRTWFWREPCDNAMAHLFWGQLSVERAAALFYHEAHSETAAAIYSLKYHGRPDIGVALGRMAAAEFAMAGFFSGIDAIVPVPLARKRQRGRGYNQSERIACGVSEATGIPVLRDTVRRTAFSKSQTELGRWGRMENVEGLFRLADAAPLRGRHILIVDDIVTTGATIMACAKALKGAGDIRLSVMTLGFTRS